MQENIRLLHMAYGQVEEGLQAEVAQQHAHLIPDLALMARNMVRDLNPQVSAEPIIICLVIFAFVGLIVRARVRTHTHL
jgi:hypothetical protein